MAWIQPADGDQRKKDDGILEFTGQGRWMREYLLVIRHPAPLFLVHRGCIVVYVRSVRCHSRYRHNRCHK